jgi:hypothetical protein
MSPGWLHDTPTHQRRRALRRVVLVDFLRAPDDLTHVPDAAILGPMPLAVVCVVERAVDADLVSDH